MTRGYRPLHAPREFVVLSDDKSKNPLASRVEVLFVYEKVLVVLDSCGRSDAVAWGFVLGLVSAFGHRSVCIAGL